MKGLILAALAAAGCGRILITRAAAAGTPLEEIPIDDAAAGRSPSIVWDGAAYAVAYEVNGEIFFARTCP